MKHIPFFALFLLFVVGCGESKPDSEPQAPPVSSQRALYETASNIGALKGLPGTTRNLNTLYYVKGYYVDGDGGGGFLEWRPSSTATADDILVFAPTQSAAD